MNDIPEQKAAARKSAFARRKGAHEAAGDDSARLLAEILAQHRGLPISGYLPIQTEIDPLPAMAEATAHGIVGVPVILGADRPLKFAKWTPNVELVEGEVGS